MDLFLTVAANLLQGADGPALQPDVSEAKSALFAAAMGAARERAVELFGTTRLVDFSQFEQRGHYVGEVGGYFRAMMWLGRLDLRLIETLPDGTQVFHPRQLGGLGPPGAQYPARVLGTAAARHTAVRQAVLHDAEGFTRIDDQEWQTELAGTTPPREVPWLSRVLPTGNN